MLVSGPGIAEGEVVELLSDRLDRVRCRPSQCKIYALSARPALTHCHPTHGLNVARAPDRFAKPTAGSSRKCCLSALSKLLYRWRRPARVLGSYFKSFARSSKSFSENISKSCSMSFSLVIFFAFASSHMACAWRHTGISVHTHPPIADSAHLQRLHVRATVGR